MSAPTADYDALGRETADAFMAGRLDTDGLAEVARHVLALDLPRAFAAVRSGMSATHTEGKHRAQA
ncbi:hypothetical protein [Gordonia malaquae]|uniref:hypothetical protein n=1 Tax=Gordonia malaquae TaxID=410332 RepID=UPI0030FE11EB